VPTIQRTQTDASHRRSWWRLQVPLKFWRTFTTAHVITSRNTLVFTAPLLNQITTPHTLVTPVFFPTNTTLLFGSTNVYANLLWPLDMRTLYRTVPICLLTLLFNEAVTTSECTLTSCETASPTYLLWWLWHEFGRMDTHHQQSYTSQANQPRNLQLVS
jgi:hypothetical protein